MDIATGAMTFSTRYPLPRNPLTCQRAFPPAHWMRTASTKQLRPRTPLIPERTQGAQVHRSHPLQNLTRISQDGNARINWNRTPAPSPKEGDKSRVPRVSWFSRPGRVRLMSVKSCRVSNFRTRILHRFSLSPKADRGEETLASGCDGEHTVHLIGE